MQDIARLEKIMGAAPVIPVVAINSVKAGLGLARALVAGGLPAIEVTLRTPVALEALAAIAEEVEGALAGAGTVLNGDQLQAVREAGAQFAVSPGATANLLAAAEEIDVPLLPGGSTASEFMSLGERGYSYLKFFPASDSGGPGFLKSIGSPLPKFRFCPTGGVSPNNALDYLSLKNVICVGGSWVAPKDLVDEGAWDKITELAQAASKLRSDTE